MLYTATVKQETKLRKNPRSNAGIAGYLEEGAVVEVLEETSELWSKVKLGAVEGYVLSEMLEPDEDDCVELVFNVPMDYAREMYEQLKTIFEGE